MTLLVRQRGKAVPLPAEAVVRIEGEGAYSRVITAEDSYLMCVTLKEWQERLPAFLRASKQVLVNPAHVVRYDVEKPGRTYFGLLSLTDGSRVEVARRRVETVRAGLSEFRKHRSNL
ncbi:LytR/AlgR family response regulator transcription factor [Larkinella soli]|uniref:LytR/AlgR family response regulator transcription factor n=1 Tax=Larkinella soli TaxID=1770527 RepID=UPI000FFB8167|nr:LytTR family DNA-binding domain-containing protein [Larkinella soli]